MKTFPVTLAAYTAAVSEALLMVKRSDPTEMMKLGAWMVAMYFKQGTAPEAVAYEILDAAMAGQLSEFN